MSISLVLTWLKFSVYGGILQDESFSDCSNYSCLILLFFFLPSCWVVLIWSVAYLFGVSFCAAFSVVLIWPVFGFCWVLHVFLFEDNFVCVYYQMWCFKLIAELLGFFSPPSTGGKTGLGYSSSVLLKPKLFWSSAGFLTVPLEKNGLSSPARSVTLSILFSSLCVPVWLPCLVNAVGNVSNVPTVSWEINLKLTIVALGLICNER